MRIIERLVDKQPGVIVELVKRRLLSTENVRQLLSMKRSEEEETSVTLVMGHDTYRRVRGRLVQTRWSA